MGSDVYLSSIWHLLIKILKNIKWSAVIVKSESMKERLKINDLYVIPNGVDLERFYPMPKLTARELLGFNDNKYVLFISNVNRPEKNFKLTQEAFEFLNKNQTSRSRRRYR